MNYAPIYWGVYRGSNPNFEIHNLACRAATL